MSRWLLSTSKEANPQPVLVLCHPHTKKCFFMFLWNLLCFSLCLLPLVLSLATTKTSLSPPSSHPPFRYSYRLIRFPLSLLFPRLNGPGFPSLSSQERCSSPLIILAPLSWTPSSISTSFSHWGAQNWAQWSRCGLTSAEQRVRILSLDLLAILCPMQPMLSLTFFAAWAHCWLMFNLVSTRTPTLFLPSCFSVGWPPACISTWIVSPEVQDFELPLDELHEVKLQTFLLYMQIRRFK